MMLQCNTLNHISPPGRSADGACCFTRPAEWLQLSSCVRAPRKVPQPGRMYVCMYVCTYVMYVYIYIYI